jgi:ParB-like chromosome segregation protein Spo0J
MKALTNNGDIFVTNEIEILADDDLIDRKGNSKKHPPEQLARLAGAIREFGFTVPLLVDEGNVIIAGHGRRIAGRSVGMEAFPCVRASHLNAGQVRALVLFDNKIAETGFDPALLKVELEELRDLDEELLGLTGFDAAELDKLTADLEGDDDEGNDGDEPKAPELRFGEQKIPMSGPELQALEMLAETYLKKHGDFVGFVEKALLKAHR